MVDTGPPYPRPVPGSNSIGQFVIGVSPIGDIPPYDYWQTVISQYTNSSILTQLISNFFQYIDQTKNMDDFFDLIWNVDTAQGAGLDIWGRIVGVTRVLTLATGNFFGFEQGTPTSDTFGPGGVSPFYSGVSTTENFNLTDAAFRVLIFAKALANISDGSIKSINQLLINLFKGSPGNAYVTDDGSMQMTYTFTFALSPVQQAIVENSGVLPKPVGVTLTIVQP